MLSRQSNLGPWIKEGENRWRQCLTTLAKASYKVIQNCDNRPSLQLQCGRGLGLIFIHLPVFLNHIRLLYELLFEGSFGGVYLTRAYIGNANSRPKTYENKHWPLTWLSCDGIRDSFIRQARPRCALLSRIGGYHEYLRSYS